MAAIDWTIEPYRAEFKTEWDRLTEQSRNATFLLRRDYMDYHADRFTDCSLIALHRGKLLCLLPANIADGELYSHQGLTYGGWILPPHAVDAVDMEYLFDAWLGWCAQQGIRAIHYKPLPWIYSRQPSQEDLNALWRKGFVKERLLMSSAVNLRCNPGFDYLRRRYLKRVADAGVSIEEGGDMEQYWQLLEQCLRQRHNAAPVHTLEEMQRLQALFPANIRLFTLSDAEGLQAGVLIYRTATADHCQYIASTEKARANRYLPYLFRFLIEECPGEYFDFGTSNEPGSQLLNAGLLANKFGYGATGVAYEQYSLKL